MAIRLCYQVSKSFARVLFIVCVFLGSYVLNSQNNPQKTQSLVSILNNLENLYEVNFTYADASLEGKSLIPPSSNLSLNAVLQYLESQTGLIFELLSNSNIIIRTEIIQDITTTQFLDEVVVTNFLTRGISLKNDGVTSIKPRQFGILPGLIEPDVLQTIQALPGITSIDERVSNLNIRGGTNDQNLILWDGIKMYQAGHFFGLISAFNPYLTETVIVSKNGSSAMYGDGVSSIIDMRSSGTVNKETEGGAGANLISGDAHIKLPFSKRSELQVSARRSITDLLTTPTYDNYFKRIFQDTDVTNQGSNSITQNERFYFFDASARYLHELSEKDKIKVNGLAIYNNLDYDEQSIINDVSEALNSNLIQSNLAAGIEYERQWNPRLRTTAQAYLSNYDLDATNFDVINDQRLIQENEVYDGGLKLHAYYDLDSNLKYFGGYQFYEVGISNLEDVNNPPFRRFVKEVIRSHALFNEVKFNSNSGNTALRIGLRTNYIEKFSEFYVEPRLSFNQRFLDHFRLEILGEIKSQTTSQIIDLQNDFLGVEKRRWILANDSNIPVIESRQISTAINYNHNGLLMSLEGYIKKVDGITTRSQGFQNQYQFVDAIGEYEVYGFDFLINKQWKSISTWLGYSFSKNEYTFPDLNFGKQFPNNVDTRHNLTFAGTYTLDQLKIALGLNWRSGKPYTLPDPENPFTNDFINYLEPNNINLPDYLRLDISATYNLKLSPGLDSTVGLSLWNVLDKNNTINTYYVLDDENQVVRIDNESLGITPNLSFRVRF
ncbi:MAG: TonB-dependent receptor plug domain-containing protein [Flavobacteriaceae bacterium]|nr:TonB-dependent receptor plug domain-containing protein [Flavobacteriaceae bacterium]